VQAVWLKEADAAPKEPFAAEVKKLQAGAGEDPAHPSRQVSNLKIVYLSSRIYGGWAGSPLNPEPHAYEGVSP
jgi:hypothetical protein